MILDGFKNKTPCFHRTISIQIDSPLPQDDIQAVSRRSDVVLQNKSAQNLIFYLLSVILNGSKNKSPCFHRIFSIQIDNPLPHDDTQVVSRQSDVELQNKSTPNLTFYLTCLWFWMALKRKLPVSTEQFQFRLIEDSLWTFSLDVTHPNSRLSDITLPNWCCLKAHLLLVLKDPFHFRLILRYTVSLSQWLTMN